MRGFGPYTENYVYIYIDVYISIYIYRYIRIYIYIYIYIPFQPLGGDSRVPHSILRTRHGLLHDPLTMSLATTLRLKNPKPKTATILRLKNVNPGLSIPVNA